MIMQPDTLPQNGNNTEEGPLLRCFISQMIDLDPSRIRRVLNLKDASVRKLVVQQLLDSKYADDVTLSREHMNEILGIG